MSMTEVVEIEVAAESEVDINGVEAEVGTGDLDQQSEGKAEIIDPITHQKVTDQGALIEAGSTDQGHGVDLEVKVP